MADFANVIFVIAIARLPVSALFDVFGVADDRALSCGYFVSRLISQTYQSRWATENYPSIQWGLDPRPQNVIRPQIVITCSFCRDTSRDSVRTLARSLSTGSQSAHALSSFQHILLISDCILRAS